MRDVNKLFDDNINLVYHISKKFYNKLDNSNFSIDDIHQIGFIALFKACKLYDEDKNIKFSTYACRAIYNDIVCELTRNNGLLRIPRDMFTAGERATLVSLDYKVEGKDGSISELYEIIEGTYDSFDDVEFKIIFNEVVGRCNEKMLPIIRYTMDGYTQDEIANMIGVTQSSVSKYIRSFKRKLRYELRRGK